MKRPLFTLILAANFLAVFSQQFSLIKDINPGSASSNVCYLRKIGNTLYFAANDGVNGMELWKSDGTAGGTVMVKDIYAGSFNSDIGYLTRVGNLLYFVANNGISGAELWKSDGSLDGTVLVKDIRTGSMGSNPTGLVEMNGQLYFAANNGPKGDELWKSDGTEAGTVLVKDINPTGSSTPQSFAAVNGLIYFGAVHPTYGMELWKSDGTAAGTVMVKDIWVGTDDGTPANIVRLGSDVLFSASDGTNGTELWRSDGTAAGTSMVLDIREGADESYPRSLVNISGNLFFSADNGDNGTELWLTDGTAAGTRLIKDIWPGIESGAEGNFTQLINKLIFIGNDGVSGYKTWQSDGSAAGTKIATALVDPGTGSIQEMVETDYRVYASLDNTPMGTELWGITYSNVLPLDFLSFTGKLNGNDAKLDWTTANEVSTDEFIIERSLDGTMYQPIGRVSAANKPGTNGYAHLDRTVTALGVSVVYYRLKQIDILGKFTYSRVVSIQLKQSASLTLYPVPAREKLQVRAMVDDAGQLKYSVLDNTGRVVRRNSQKVIKGMNNLEIPINALSAGAYFIQLEGEGLNEVRRFVKY